MWFALLLIALLIWTLIGQWVARVGGNLLEEWGSKWQVLQSRPTFSRGGGALELCTVPRQGKRALRYWTLAHDTVVSRPLRVGVPWEGWMHKYFERYARGSTALDIGANIGTHTVVLAELADYVHAFEPQPAVFDLLKRNVAANGAANVTCHQLGLGERNGTAIVEEQLLRGGLNVGGARLVEGADGQVRIVPLDSLAVGGRIGFIKLDVEGFECAVLRGARQTIAAHQPVLIVEDHTWHKDALRLLEREHSYTCLRLSFANDFLCLPPSAVQ